DVSTRRRPPRHRSGDPFIKGPIPYAWIASACRLPGSGLHVAMACRFLCGRYRRPNRWGLTTVVPIARAAPRARQRALTTGLRVAVHHLGPLLLRPKEACRATGLGRVRNGQNEDQSGAGGKHRVGVPIATEQKTTIFQAGRSRERW